MGARYASAKAKGKHLSTKYCIFPVTGFFAIITSKHQSCFLIGRFLNALFISALAAKHPSPASIHIIIAWLMSLYFTVHLSRGVAELIETPFLG